MRRIAALCTVGFLLVAGAVFSPAFAQRKKGDTGTRSVQGVVSNPDDSPAVGAVVQLENAKTQQIRSYVTKEDGVYKFFELSTDADYKLNAKMQGLASPSKTLSSFDSKKEVTLNLKLAAAK
jgi:type 1 fimbria pilin